MRSSFQRTGEERSNFRSDDRGQQISGLFSDHGIDTRYADHDHIRMGSWRSLNRNTAVSPTGAQDAMAGSLSSIVTKMKRSVSRSRCFCPARCSYHFKLRAHTPGRQCDREI